MRITTAWLIGTGLHEGLTLAQVYAHKPGEIIDLYSQEAIRAGAEEKREIETIEDLLKLR